ncbi:FG-GAP repeat domain-containing protein [Glycomyces albidus]|uniref:VCBS repeat-containing protein n=1 Tax=Glycomyces albidus TaxID=2656774 RepID=A0A6L5G7U3_9ACTN|nr:VCBS repeat-containing protein [Glycomyces albidus]MQM25691.1 hypothetical protein [Glycomyces albidus]
MNFTPPRGRTAAFTAAAVGAALLAVPGAAAAQTTEIDCGALGERPSAAATEPALEIANACGVEVVIEAVTTDYDTYSATPEGRLRRVSTVPSAEMLQAQGAADPTLTEADGSLVQADSEWDLTLGLGGDAPLLSTPAAGLHWAESTPAPTYSGTEVHYDDLAPGLDLTLDARVSDLGLRFDIADEAAWNALSSGLDLDYWAVAGGGRLQNTLDLAYPVGHPERQTAGEQTTPFYLRDSAGDGQALNLAVGTDGVLSLTPAGGGLGEAAFPLTVTAQWTYRQYGVNEWASVTSAEPDLTLFRGDGGRGEPYFVAAGQNADAVVGPYCDATADPECSAPAQAATYWNFWGGTLGDLLPSSVPAGATVSVAEAEFRVDAAEGAECVAPELLVTRVYRPHLSWTDRPLPTGTRPPAAGACIDGTAVYDLGPWSLASGFPGPTFGMTASEETARFDGGSARLDLLWDIEAANFTTRSCNTMPTYPQLRTGTVPYGGFTADLWRPDLVDQDITWTATVRNADTGEVVAVSAPAEVADGTAPASTFAVDDGYYSVRHEFKHPSGAVEVSDTCYYMVDDSKPEFVAIEVPPGPHFVGDIVPVEVTVADAGFPNGVSKLTIHCLGDDDCEPETTVLVDDTTFTLNLEIKQTGTTLWMLQMYDQRSLVTYSQEIAVSASYNRGDYNGDDHQDLFAVRRSDGNLLFFAGNGDGTLASGVSRGAGWGAMDIAMAGDLTGDGIADLLARDTRTGVLYTYPGNGAGGLGTRIQAGTGWNAQGVFTSSGDFDGDGKTDLYAVGKSDRKLYFYPGLGNGTFGARTAVSTGWGGIDTITTLADANRDGRPDLLARKHATGEYFLYHGQGDGTVGARQKVYDDEDGLSSAQYNELTAADDYDGDGTGEVVGIDAFTGELVMHSFNDFGDHVGRRVVDDGWEGLRLPGTAVDRAYDFDASGFTDVLARHTTGTVYFYPGNGSSGFGQSSQWGTGMGGMNLLETAGDLTGDGIPDLLARVASNGALYVIPGTAYGDFSYEHRIQVGTGWNAMSAIVSGQDFNGDGKVDIVARERSTGYLWFYPGRGDGKVGTRVNIGTGWNALGGPTAVGDLDHDGHADLVAVRGSDGCLYRYSGRGDGTLKAAVKLGCGWSGMNGLASVGDFNLDGHADWVARSTANGNLYLYRGTSAGSYSPPLLVGAGWNTMNIVI